MGSKYRISYKQYDDLCFYEYQTRWLIAAVFKFVKLRFKYELVDFVYKK